jgi:AhpD family alkylhydroperoxidase
MRREVEEAMDEKQLKEIVKEKYGEAASRAVSGAASCCGPSAACGERDPITADLYDAAQLSGIPEEAVLASLGCGNPTALAELKPGEVVLDLGSGGGIDVLLSARRVGPSGKAYGLDMTEEMLALARENQRKAGVENVEFLKGEIENIPLPDNSVDVIISNCVINLAADKDRVLREAHRVLKPGGRLAVSDVVVRGGVPPEIRRSVELWIGCVAGALEESEYHAKLAAVGFDAIELEPTRVYRAEDVREFLASAGIDAERIAAQVDGKFFSAFVRARKPAIAESRQETKRMMKKLQVFDPPMCCSTGVCGPSPDPVLPRFAADFHWLAGQGVVVERYNLVQEPQAFAANETVKAALAKYGNDCLPLILVNDVIVSRGSYPTRKELARFVGVEDDEAPSLYNAAVAELVAIGAAIASNCEPCFKFHFDKARKLGVSLEDMTRAVETAQAVKESPARSVLELASRFLKRDQAPKDLPVVPSSCCSPGTAAPPGGQGGCC